MPVVNQKEKNPKMNLDAVKRVKILATVGPATTSRIKEMLEAGVDGFRLNFSHGTLEEKVEQVRAIREASKKRGKPVAIVQDLHGPKVALSKFDHGPIELSEGSIWNLKFRATLNLAAKILPLEINLSTLCKSGEALFIGDGRIRAVIEAVDVAEESIQIKIINGGLVTSGKGLNLPDTDFRGSVITEKDIDDVTRGASLGFDYIALSFIQRPEDVLFFRNLLSSLGCEAKLIAKIETRSAVENLESILDVSDGAMVARGDLAVEVGAEAVPILQRKITGLCISKKKLCVVATQMLASMVASPDPTRAEVSDVATAVIVGADCVMLSEETAIGAYPIETIQSMKRVILYTQANSNVRPIFDEPPQTDAKLNIVSAIAGAVIKIAEIVSAIAIVVETKTGASALEVSAYRTKRTIIAVTPEDRVAQRLAIAYGIKSFVRPDDKLAATKLTNWLKSSEILKTGDVVVSTSGKYPGRVGSTDTIKVRIV